LKADVQYADDDDSPLGYTVDEPSQCDTCTISDQGREADQEGRSPQDHPATSDVPPAFSHRRHGMEDALVVDKEQDAEDESYNASNHQQYTFRRAEAEECFGSIALQFGRLCQYTA
jgi:hypothetical protein